GPGHDRDGGRADAAGCAGRTGSRGDCRAGWAGRRRPPQLGGSGGDRRRRGERRDGQGLSGAAGRRAGGGPVIPLSVLDLVPVREGEDVSDALRQTGELAAAAEAAGYKRFWVAEHHATEGVAGGAASVVLAHVGHCTSTIRIGSGGIMLPNHNPFVIAEQF